MMKVLKKVLSLMTLGEIIKHFVVRIGILLKRRKLEELDGKNNIRRWKITMKKTLDSLRLNHARWI